jgi:transcriptional regulator with XRE-family HTH domain
MKRSRGAAVARRTRGEAERRLALIIAPAIRDTRRALRRTQADLADRCGMSQSQISRAEAGALGWVTVEEVGRLLDVLGIRLDISLHRPYVTTVPFQQDAAHARALAYVARRLQAMGWEVKLEVEIVEGRARGWIDALAYHPEHRAVFVAEVKAGLDDMGAAERQLGWYRRAAGLAARSFGWRSASSAGALLVLATEANDQLITANHGVVSRNFPIRAAALHEWLDHPASSTQRLALALIDPRTRRRRWLQPLALDGRRTALRYAGYADFMRSVRAR